MDLRTYDAKTGKRVKLGEVIGLSKKEIITAAMKELERQYGDLERWDKSDKDVDDNEYPSYKETLKASLEARIDEGDQFFIANDGSIFLVAELQNEYSTVSVPVRIS